MRILLVLMFVMGSVFARMPREAYVEATAKYSKSLYQVSNNSEDGLDAIGDSIASVKGSKSKGNHMYACLPYKVAFYSMKACKKFKQQGPGSQDDRDCQCRKMGKKGKGKKSKR